MWSNWNSQEIATDFKQMNEAGLDLVRFFIFTSDFVRDGKVVPHQIEHYKELLGFLEGGKLQCLPTFFVGHMSGQNYRVSGWDETTFLTDSSVLSQQKDFLQAILAVSQDSQQIAGWSISNEIPNDFPGRNASEVTKWVAEITCFIRQHDTRPITLGDGVWSPEVSGAGVENHLEPSSHYHLRDLAPLQDTLGVHFYPRSDDYWLQAYTAGFRLLMAGSWKSTVFLEEFGNSVSMASEKNQALYYRGVLFSALQTGATAGLSWCWTDFDLPNLRPYFHNTFEMRFGLRRLDGSFRPALDELQSISRLSHENAAEGWALAPRNDLLIIPASFYSPFPFDWDTNNAEKYDLYLHSYGALASSGALIRCVHEPGVEYRAQDHEIHLTHNTSFSDQPGIFWLPALKRLSAPFWKLLLDKVEQGGVLYASFANDHWINDLDSLLGIDSQLRFGLPDFYPETEMTLSSPGHWGFFGDAKISLPTSQALRDRSLSYLPAELTSAELLLSDSKGRPMLIRQNHGSGTLYYSLFPFEMLMLKSCDEAVRTFVTLLYASIREEHTQTGSSCTSSAAEFLRFTRGAETKEYLFNHAWEQRAFKVRLKDNTKNNKNIRVELPPKSFCQIVDTTLDATENTQFA